MIKRGNERWLRGERGRGGEGLDVLLFHKILATTNNTAKPTIKIWITVILTRVLCDYGTSPLILLQELVLVVRAAEENIRA